MFKQREESFTYERMPPARDVIATSLPSEGSNLPRVQEEIATSLRSSQ